MQSGGDQLAAVPLVVVSLVVVVVAVVVPGVGRTRSVGKAPTTSSHLLTTNARFCYTKCAEVCSRMWSSIRHVAHQNVFFFSPANVLVVAVVVVVMPFAVVP